MLLLLVVRYSVVDRAGRSEAIRGNGHDRRAVLAGWWSAKGQRAQCAVATVLVLLHESRFHAWGNGEVEVQPQQTAMPTRP